MFPRCFFLLSLLVPLLSPPLLAFSPFLLQAGYGEVGGANPGEFFQGIMGLFGGNRNLLQGVDQIRQNVAEFRSLVTAARSLVDDSPLPEPEFPSRAGPPRLEASGAESSSSASSSLAAILATSTGRQMLGVSESQARALAAAQAAGLDPFSPPEPEPANCKATNYTCQFVKACYPCFYNARLDRCSNCLQLQACRGVMPCQLNWVCKACKTLDKSDYWPVACDRLQCIKVESEKKETNEEKS